MPLAVHQSLVSDVDILSVGEVFAGDEVFDPGFIHSVERTSRFRRLMCEVATLNISSLCFRATALIDRH